MKIRIEISDKVAEALLNEGLRGVSEEMAAGIRGQASLRMAVVKLAIDRTLEAALSFTNIIDGTREQFSDGVDGKPGQPEFAEVEGVEGVEGDEA